MKVLLIDDDVELCCLLSRKHTEPNRNQIHQELQTHKKRYRENSPQGIHFVAPSKAPQ